MDAFSIIHSCKVLSDFEHQAIERLARVARFEDFSSGQLVVQHGRRIDHLGIVVAGTIEARYRTDRASVVIHPGQVYGEMSLLTGEPSTADIVAMGAVRVLEIPFATLSVELSQAPIASARLARLLVLRLSHREEDPGEQAALQEARKEARIQRKDEVPMNGEPVLVVNCGSSSLKYALFAGGARKASGLVERIGAANHGGGRHRFDGPNGRMELPAEVPDHEAALRIVLDMLTDPIQGVLERIQQIVAVGHRAVHGGDRFSESVRIDAEVREEMRRCCVLAPLHNPANLVGIEVCERLLPEVPQVAVFDTAFHMTMPEHAWRYALPQQLSAEHRLRRYGFHGTSHKYVTRATGTFLGTSANELRLITCHLGNGASLCAVDHGRSVDTSMGLTPLEGLVMGTRSGDLDPGLILHLLNQGMTVTELEKTFNKQSGLLGLSGLSNDMRELESAADSGHPGAILALQVFCYRVRKYVGAYTAVMGGLDVLAFTGGIGENDSVVRSRVCQGLGFLGLQIDETRNARRLERGELAMEVSTPESRVRALVVPTDEEGMIAVETDHALKRAGVTQTMRRRKDRPIPIGVSAHHVHLSTEHVEALFGPGHTLTFRSPLTQVGQFACEETVDIVGPKGRIDRVRVLGPVRPSTQVEISRTEQYRLGIDAPIRPSGSTKGSPGVTLVGTSGRVPLPEGVICSQRHIHMSPEEALGYGVRDGDEVRVEVRSEERTLIFGDVSVRVHPTFKLELHLDTDEANAAVAGQGAVGYIDSIQHRRG